MHCRRDKSRVKADVCRPTGPLAPSILLDFLSQLRLSDLVQRFLRRQRHFGNVVPESIFHHVQITPGGLLPQDVGVDTCSEGTEFMTHTAFVCFAKRFRKRSLTGEQGQDENSEDLHG